MATQEVPINFICRGETTFSILEFKHQLPSSLIIPTSGPIDRELFSSTLGPIMDGHQADARAACSKGCIVCGLEEAKVKIVPASRLGANNPHINIFASSVCDKAACELQAQKDIVAYIAQTGKEKAAAETGLENKIYEPCAICGNVEKTMRCKKCLMVSYCGAEHQKEDWVKHKKICKKPIPSIIV